MTNPLREKLRRKSRKLLRNPDRFFFDLFAKRLDVAVAEHPTDADGMELPRDFITDLDDVYKQVISTLVQRTCAVQEMDSAYSHVRRLAVKYSDIAYVLETIEQIAVRDIRPVVEPAPSRYGITTIRWTDGSVVYCNPTIEIDPWRLNGALVQSANENLFSSTIHADDIHLTVESPAPLYLAGDPNPSLSMSARLGWKRSILNHFDHPIDIVYTWVDDADPEWRARKAKRIADGRRRSDFDVSDVRFRSRDELRYSLRSVASFFPQVRHIYIVTDGQTPSWLDTSDDRITVVDHKSIFPSADHLPSFNSHAIEANLFRIEGLSEHFLYFNDDIFLTNPCSELDFFHVNGIGRSFFEANAHVSGRASSEHPGFKNAALRGSEVLSARYGKSAHRYHEHTVHVMRRSAIESMWNEFGDVLMQTSAAAFRGDDDISPLSFFYHYYAVHNGYSVPSSIAFAYVPLGRPGSGQKLDALLTDRTTKVACLNDVSGVDSAAEVAVRDVLRRLYPKAARWETDQ